MSVDVLFVTELNLTGVLHPTDYQMGELMDAGNQQEGL